MRRRIDRAEGAVTYGLAEAAATLEAARAPTAKEQERRRRRAAGARGPDICDMRGRLAGKGLRHG